MALAKFRGVGSREQVLWLCRNLVHELVFSIVDRLVSEDQADLPPIVVEILLQKRQDLPGHDTAQIGKASHLCEVRVPDRLIAMQQMREARIHRVEQLTQIDLASFAIGDDPKTLAVDIPCIRHQLLKAEPPPECRVEKRDGAVGGVHCADQIDIRWHAETVA